ncbi:MAG: alanine--tRNA ligase [Rickettsiales bacterium]|nr:alanine--tRNA ligase [Rickettsiales bacterium]
MPTMNDVRAQFLSYFEKQDHLLLPSAPLVPQSDPTLMFTAAGMVPFKNIFTGLEKPPAPRVTSSQKCVRAGGKHNDLDNVGYTARHHTFFEMLGNFSFGDYFKEEAIHYCWDLTTNVFGLDKSKMLVTVYHTDDEAINLWKKIAGLSDDRIIKIATKDNFWQAGDTGPCGPCSELFYDHGDHIPGGPPGSPDEDGDRFIEIWNLVFMQYNRQADGVDNPLPKPSIDTGMGLERITALLQGKHDNYETDLFLNLIAASEELTSVKAQGDQLASHRVIADHLRTSCFLMADGVLPSNEGRGYVLRRIMRRAMRHAHILGAKEPLMHRLVPNLINEMGVSYPELGRAQATITENLRLEEERFRETLGRGLKLLEEETTSLSKGDKLAGSAAFKLYDTYGFPIDLTQDILRGQGMSVDTDGFDSAMAEQKARARAAWKGSGDTSTQEIWLELRDEHGATEFLGYDTESAAGQLIAIVKDGVAVDRASKGDEIALLFNQTPFYGESGGQQGDQGEIYKQSTLLGKVSDTSKPTGSLHVHHTKLLGDIALEDALELKVNTERRTKLRANHSATHLLNAALRQVLGDHVSQKGSDVAEDKLRFDISHPKALTADEIAQTETLVNQQIWANKPTSTKLMNTDDAITAGATAMFGEKYGDEVRVVAMGIEDYSVELCGGTHVTRTGDIGLLKITSEGALASGVRRLEAVTRDTAFAWFNARNNSLMQLSDTAKTPIPELPEKLESLMTERKRIEKELGEAKRKLALSGGSAGVGAKEEKIGTIDFAYQAFEGINPKDLRSLATEIMAKHNADIVAVASNFEGKAAIVVAASKESGIDSAALVRVATPAVGGQGGGGRPEMAQAGGPDGDKVSEALEAIKHELTKNNENAA